jgi:uncharacterized membrane protein YgaE (UPF0421/DUF939 family)
LSEGTSIAAARPVIRGALLYGVGAAVVAMFSYATAARMPGLREAYWAPIASIVVLYPNREATLKAGFQRFLGTAIGSLIGWGCAAWWHGNILAYGVGVMLAVAACHLLRCEAAARICAVAVTVITIIPRVDPPHLVALQRFVEVSYGVGCTMAFTVAVDVVMKRLRRTSPTTSGG